MNILSKYHEKTKFDLKQSKEEIIAKLYREKEKRRGLLDSILEEPVDFNDIIFYENKSEYVIKPTWLGRGKIKVLIKENENYSGTEIFTEIIPYNEGYYIAIFLLFTFLIIWTITALAITNNGNTFTIVVISWVIFPFILFLLPIYNKSRLREYRDEFIKIVTNKSSR